MDKNALVVLENILQRRSVRHFIGKPVDREMIAILLEAAMAAPSARNRQPWTFVAVTERETLDKMAGGLPRTRMLFSAAAAIIVCGDSTVPLDEGAEDLWYLDAAACSENILLAAQALGLGAVWSALYPYAERMGHVSTALGLPLHVTPFSVIPLGYPAGEEMPRDKFRPERIHWETW